MTIEEQMDIELILTEAAAWGLQNEVEQSAKQFINEGHKAVDAYQYAYEDWVK
jgi:predicted transcriptional regulator